jgi:hypothetical protein
MKAIWRWSLSILLLALLIAQPVRAFDYPLSSEAIREAYFLGKENPDRRQSFFQPYRHSMPTPKTGADVGLIEVETPFACVVDSMAQAPSTYHAPDAVQDYLGKPGQFRVHVEIYFTDTYPKPTDTAATLGNFWEDFHVHLKQGAEIKPRAVHGEPIYNDQTISGYIGANIDLDYDVKKIDSGGLTTIDVETPDGQDVQTTFSLNNLR